MRAAAVVLGLASFARTAEAQIVVGPYTFTDETWFADTASMNVPEPLFLPLSITTIEEAVVGYSPETGIMNVGSGCGGEETVDAGFTDVLPFEGSGPDVILFDAQYSIDDIAVRVRPVGGSFGDVHIYLAAEQTPTGVTGPGVGGPMSSSTLVGVNVDFADFGLPLGAVVDRVQVVGNCQLTPPIAEVDVVMAALVDRSCVTDDDCDDGDPCTSETCPAGTCAFAATASGTPCTGGVCVGTWPPTCVECIDSGDCNAPTPLCDQGACVECINADDCEEDDEPCTLKSCGEGSCFLSTAPAGTPCDAGVCLGIGVSCVECVVSTDCPRSKPVCKEAQSTCIECVDDEGCDDGDECTEDSCEQETCQHAGECPSSDGGGGQGSSSSTSSTGTGAGGDEDGPPPDDGCDCAMGSAEPENSMGLLALVAGIRVVRSRRRRFIVR